MQSFEACAKWGDEVGPELDISLAVSDWDFSIETPQTSCQSNIHKQLQVFFPRVHRDGATSTRLSLAVIGLSLQFLLLLFFCIDLHWFASVVCFRSSAHLWARTHTHSWNRTKKLKSSTKTSDTLVPQRCFVDHTTDSLVFWSTRKAFSWEMSTTASCLFMEMSFKWSSSVWSLAKFTNTWNEHKNI